MNMFPGAFKEQTVQEEHSGETTAEFNDDNPDESLMAQEEIEKDDSSEDTVVRENEDLDVSMDTHGDVTADLSSHPVEETFVEEEQDEENLSEDEQDTNGKRQRDNVKGNAGPEPKKKKRNHDALFTVVQEETSHASVSPRKQGQPSNGKANDNDSGLKVDKIATMESRLSLLEKTKSKCSETLEKLKRATAQAENKIADCNEKIWKLKRDIAVAKAVPECTTCKGPLDKSLMDYFCSESCHDIYDNQE